MYTTGTHVPTLYRKEMIIMTWKLTCSMFVRNTVVQHVSVSILAIGDPALTGHQIRTEGSCSAGPV